MFAFITYLHYMDSFTPLIVVPVVIAIILIFRRRRRIHSYHENTGTDNVDEIDDKNDHTGT